LAASKTLTDEQRALRARLAAHESWANTENRSARTKAGHRSSPGSVDYWLDRVDPDGTLTPEARQAAAQSKRNAYKTRLALAGDQAQRDLFGAELRRRSRWQRLEVKT
jgi:hypothetical protein